MELRLTEQKALTLYRIILRWDELGSLTAEDDEERSCYGIYPVRWKKNWSRWMMP